MRLGGKMRIIFDNNTWISSLLSHPFRRRLEQIIEAEGTTVLVCDEMLSELRDARECETTGQGNYEPDCVNPAVPVQSRTDTVRLVNYRARTDVRGPVNVKRNSRVAFSTLGQHTVKCRNNTKSRTE